MSSNPGPRGWWVLSQASELSCVPLLCPIFSSTLGWEKIGLCLYFGVSLFFSTKGPQAQGCLVKRKGEKEGEKEREAGRKERRTFWKEAWGSKTLGLKDAGQGMEALRNPGSLEGDNKELVCLIPNHVLLFPEGLTMNLAPGPWPLAGPRRQQHPWELVRKAGFGAPPQIWCESDLFLLTRTCGASHAHSTEKHCPGSQSRSLGVSGLDAWVQSELW